ncbi:hypothetical protein MKX03_016716, partial [Papaver bracteatum]
MALVNTPEYKIQCDKDAESMAQQNGLPDLPSREETSSDEENNVHYCAVLLLKNELPAD